MILREAFTKAVAILKDSAVPSAQRDARALIAHALGVALDRVMIEAERPINKDEMKTLNGLLERRCCGEPVARIIGKRLFWGRSFIISPDVLDPRGDTETLVEVALRRKAKRILDLGTGSGCIGLTLLAEWPAAHLTATDVSKAALNIAKRNADCLKLSARTEFLNADWFDHPRFSQTRTSFDLIVSNPPYIATSEFSQLERDVINYDPMLALSPGENALVPYRKISREAKCHLVRKGRIIFEIGCTLARSVQEILEEEGFRDIKIFKDLEGKNRVIQGVLQ